MNFRKKAALALAGAFIVGACSRDVVFSKSVTPLFNSAATSTTCGNIPEYRVPSAVVPRTTNQEIWRIRASLWEIAAGGHHMFLEFLPYSGDGDCQPDTRAYQVHGLMMDGGKRTWAQIEFNNPSMYLKNFTGGYDLRAAGVTESYNSKYFAQQKEAYVDIFYGTKDEVLRMYMDAMVLADKLNQQDHKYNMLTHNSNSVFRTMVEGLGLKLPDSFEGGALVALRNQDKVWWTPGYDRSLLPADWDREKVRQEQGYATLGGKALENAVKKAMIAPERSWDNLKKPAVPPAP